MVSKRGRSRLPQIGDRVRVPFGLKSVEGVVVRNDGVIRNSITVQFEIDGADGDFLNDYAPEDIEIISAA